MSGNLVPPINTKGMFEVRSPFSLKIGKVYVCEEIRTYDELSRLGVDVYNKVYVPAGLTVSDFNSDATKKASLITLKSSGGSPVYIPSTYIDKYPGMSPSDYEVTVIAVECGLLPDGYDLSTLKSEILDLTKATIGALPIVTVANHYYDGLIEPEEAAAMELARETAIATYTSKDTTITELTNAVTELTNKNDVLSRDLAKFLDAD